MFFLGAAIGVFVGFVLGVVYVRQKLKFAGEQLKKAIEFHDKATAAYEHSVEKNDEARRMVERATEKILQNNAEIISRTYNSGDFSQIR